MNQAKNVSDFNGLEPNRSKLTRKSLIQLMYFILLDYERRQDKVRQELYTGRELGTFRVKGTTKAKTVNC